MRERDSEALEWLDLVILDIEARALEQIEDLEAIGADVFGRLHPVKRGAAGGAIALGQPCC